MNSQTSTIQTKAQASKRTAESVENVSAIKRLLKIKTNKMTFRQNFPPFHIWYFRETRVGCPRIA